MDGRQHVLVGAGDTLYAFTRTSSDNTVPYKNLEVDMITRREFGKLTLAGLAIAGQPDGQPACRASSVVNSVHLGVQTQLSRSPRTPAPKTPSTS